MSLTQRQATILSAIVENFISTAKPISSKMLSQRLDLGVCSATIRKEMAELEKLGFLTHPHTSAGRIPTTKGYRFYIDRSFENWYIKEEDKQKIKKRLNLALEVETLIEETATMLSEITQNVSLISAPRLSSKKIYIKHIEFIPLSNHYVLVLLVTSCGVVHQKVVKVPEVVTPKVLFQIAHILNKKLYGMPLEEIHLLNLSSLEEEIVLFTKIFREIIKNLMQETLIIKGEEKIYLKGTTYIINQPEFKDDERLKSILYLLREDIIRQLLLEESLPHLFQKVRAIIGEESRFSEMRNCSLITAKYSAESGVSGVMGVLGPKRMDYSKIMPSIEFIADNLGETLTQISLG